MRPHRNGNVVMPPRSGWRVADSVNNEAVLDPAVHFATVGELRCKQMPFVVPAFALRPEHLPSQATSQKRSIPQDTSHCRLRVCLLDGRPTMASFRSCIPAPSGLPAGDQTQSTACRHLRGSSNPYHTYTHHRHHSCQRAHSPGRWCTSPWPRQSYPRRPTSASQS